MLATKLTGRFFISNELSKCVRKMSSSKATYEEIKIPMPWGHVSGKWWGPQDKQPILAFHGWQDNAGSFDRLIPHLLPDTGVVAVDFPGHGLSSRLPTGTFYHLIDSVVLVKRIVDYFKWEKVSLLGHSLGAIVNFTYTMLYPDKVTFLICIEGLKPLVFEEKKLERMVKSIDAFLKYDSLINSGEPPSYTTEELKKLLYEGSRKSIDLENCKYILQRNIRPSKDVPDKYYFGRDPRLKVQELLGWAQKDIINNVHRVTSPLLFCRASRGPFVEKKEHSVEFVEKLVNCNKHFEFYFVDGTHHIHLNNPEAVASLIKDFIKKHGDGGQSSSGFNPDLIVDKQKLIEM